MTTHTPGRDAEDAPDRMATILRALVERMRPGTSWHTPQHGRVHILAVVDKDQIVYRTWERYGRRWRYEVAWAYKFWLHDRAGDLSYKGIFPLTPQSESGTMDTSGRNEPVA